jgi:Tfp pilus assembly protein PilV
MAGNKLNIGAKVQASTILEVVIAMVLIIVVFGIAMMIYTNVLSSSLSVKKIKAQAVLQQTLIKTEQLKGITSQSITVDDFRVEQEVKPYNGSKLLNDIHLTAYDANQRKIAELEKVIINNDEAPR